MRFITKQIHAYLDYPVAIVLIGLPFLLGLGSSNPLAFQLSLITGIAALVLTVLTDHHLGLFRVIPYQIHLIVDFLVGVVFILAPFIFSFEGLDAYYYWLNGFAVLSVVSMHKPDLIV
ncbi:MAG: SPW repeat domain-containing protein [Chitinophagales bacterium]